MKTYRAGDEIPPDEPFAYLTAAGGHYLIKRNELFDACVRAASLPGLSEQREYCRLRAGKIPRPLFLQALAFMEKVYELHRSEALLLLTLDQGRWGLQVPEQEVSGAGIHYLTDGCRRLAGSIHSHPGMTRTPSSVDEHDEIDFDGIHLIVNGFDPGPRSTTCFAVVNGRRFPLLPGAVVEGLEREDVSFPAEWLEKVRPERWGLGEERADGRAASSYADQEAEREAMRDEREAIEEEWREYWREQAERVARARAGRTLAGKSIGSDPKSSDRESLREEEEGEPILSASHQASGKVHRASLAETASLDKPADTAGVSGFDDLFSPFDDLPFAASHADPHRSSHRTMHEALCEYNKVGASLQSKENQQEERKGP